MSKSPESNEAIDQEKRKQELEQQLKEEYQNLTYTQALWAFSPFETGNKKYDDLNKEYLTLTNNNLGIIDNFTNAITNTFGGGINAVIEAKKLVDDVQALKAAKKAGDKQNTVDATLKTIKDVGPIAQNLSSILHSGVISDASKDAILQYAFTPYILTPLLNKKLTKVTKNFQTSELEKINVLEGLSPRFIRELATLGVDLASNALGGELNPKVQEIYKNIKQKTPQSQANILKNLHDIITSDKVNPLLKENLVKFLKKPENQKELAQVTENILNNKVQKFVAPELLKNTIGLIANSSDKLIESTPFAIEAFRQFIENQLWTNTNLGLEGVNTELKKELLQAKKPEVIKLVNNAKKAIDNLAPILKEELPKYLDTNKQNILGILDNPIVTEKIKSSAIEPELVRKALDASMPFLAEALPSLTKLASSSLAEGEKVADIIQKAQLIKSLPKEEKSKEVKGLINAVIQLQNDNPEIKKVIQQELPELLEKHANTLGPVVNEFLKETSIGQKLKLDGEKLVNIASKHAPDLINIADKFSKG
ncbi:MAG: hypothetical protein RLZZ81_69 [Pseudomonadota bacterium]|jgi:hypothetical protein